MKRIFGVFLLLIISIFSFSDYVNGAEKSEVILNFNGASIVDGYAKYDGLGEVHLLKDDVKTDITNNMKIDLNEAKYELEVNGYILDDNPDSILKKRKVALIVNDWYYGLPQNHLITKLDANKYSGSLDIRLEEYSSLLVNTRVEKVYDYITSVGEIDLKKDKSYIIDFTKDDELTNGLKLFADLEKTIYYKNVNGCLTKTDDESEAVIKIVGNEDENRAVLTIIDNGNRKSDVFKGVFTKYTGSKLQYDGMIENIINETRTDYYTECNYNFTFNYANDKKYEFIMGANQVYRPNGGTKLSFKINADYELFKDNGEVYIDDRLVDSSNYTAESGSTIIVFNDEYSNTLIDGVHSLRVVFGDEGEATTEFTINKLTVIENPKTFDKGICEYVIISIICVLGAIISGAILKKKYC